MVIAAFSIVYGNPIRIINGYDSFGNTCGTKNNKPVENLTLSGLDTSDKPFLLFYDVKNLKESLKICVKECPSKTMTTIDEIYKYHLEGVDVCKYDFNYKSLTDKSIDQNVLLAPLGPCPVLPLYEGLVPIPLINQIIHFLYVNFCV